MRKLIIALLLVAAPALGLAAGPGVSLEKADVDLGNQASLQRGAAIFTNYCLSCHSAQYMRYQRVANDLGLTEEQVKENLMFTTDKIGEVMKVAMSSDDAANWFGTTPPDLSVVARSRGADWLYSYLKAFYVDESRPFGVNNAVFADVAMPHVLWELEGLKKPVYETHTSEGGRETETLVGYEMVRPGIYTEVEYDRAVNDLVNYLVYMGEPAKLVRYELGIWVLLFLVLLFVVSYFLKKEYWKDVH